MNADTEVLRLRGLIAQLAARVQRLETLRHVDTGSEHFTEEQRPQARTRPVGAMIWNDTTQAPNWSDGEAWRDASGTKV